MQKRGGKQKTHITKIGNKTHTHKRHTHTHKTKHYGNIAGQTTNHYTDLKKQTDKKQATTSKIRRKEEGEE